MSRVLVAGMGKVLRRDDGFGVEVAQRLALPEALPAGVKVIEVGIGGVHLAQEVMNGYDALVLIDAIEQSGPPGTVHGPGCPPQPLTRRAQDAAVLTGHRS